MAVPSGTLVLAKGPSGTIIDTTAAASAVQDAINNASTGDTVRLPLNGSATWSTAVSLPSTKAITLDLNGCAITLSGASGEFTINAHATGNNRVTNGSVIRSGTSYNLYSGPFIINDSATGAAPIIDGITFTGANVLIDANGIGPCLMYDCTLPSMGGAQEAIHITGYGAENTTGWSVDVTPGGASALYIEDCTFTTTSSASNTGWIQGYYGCRVVIRYNRFNYASVDMHGTGGNVGARWWECYGNQFWNESPNNHISAFSMRAGSGVIFSNTMVAGSYHNVQIGLGEEDSGYPALYQIGRGKDQALDPAYVWDNTNISLALDGAEATCVEGMVQLNRDVYASARPGYTPYTYPHPLRGA